MARFLFEIGDRVIALDAENCEEIEGMTGTVSNVIVGSLVPHFDADPDIVTVDLDAGGTLEIEGALLDLLPEDEETY